jgi:hypothetical protein
LLSMAALVAAVLPLFEPGGQLALPFAGTGLLFGALAFFLVMGGAVSELVFKTGDADLTAFSRVLAVSRGAHD